MIYNQNKLERNIAELDTVTTHKDKAITSILGKFNADKITLKLLLIPERAVKDDAGIEHISVHDWFKMVYEEVKNDREDFTELLNRISKTNKEAYILGENMQLMEYHQELWTFLEMLGMSIDPGPSNTTEIENPHYYDKMNEY
jgi:hypothetical protein